MPKPDKPRPDTVTGSTGPVADGPCTKPSLTLHPKPAWLNLLAVLAVVFAAALAAAPTAIAGTGQVSVMQDDDRLIYGSDAVRDGSLDVMRTAGVDVIRITALWKVLAPTRLRGTFDGANPRSYSPRIWNRFDRLIIGTYLRGMTPYVNVTWPGPTWAQGRTRNLRLRRRGSFRPNRFQFARFVEAVGRRYSGRYRDEDDGNHILPRVQIWSIGNEPNQAGWLSPQWVRRPNGRWVAASPRLYRELYYTGRAALTRSGHDGDGIIFGELAPLGRSDRGPTSPIRPERFLHEMFCLDPGGNRYQGAAARIRGCSQSRFKPVRATAFGYHPYSPEGPPESRPRHQGEFTMSNLKRLPLVLDRLAKRTGKLQEGLYIWLTEYGYETNPPDQTFGVALHQQSQYLNTADFLAYRQSRVAAVSQLLLADANPLRRPGSRKACFRCTYQSGLLFANGTPKLAYFAYRMPIYVKRISSTSLLVWGQARFKGNVGPHRVDIQFRPASGGGWQSLGSIQTNNGFGFFEKSVLVPADGFIRTLSLDDGQTASREVFVRQHL